MKVMSEVFANFHVVFMLTDNSQHTLVQVNSTLDARLVIAREKSAAAQKVIAEKEEKYLKIRSEKESILQEITKESLMLRNEAEGNSMVSFSKQLRLILACFNFLWSFSCMPLLFFWGGECACEINLNYTFICK
jgi:hypothetical protein